MVLRNFDSRFHPTVCYKRQGDLEGVAVFLLIYKSVHNIKPHHSFDIAVELTVVFLIDYLLQGIQAAVRSK